MATNIQGSMSQQMRWMIASLEGRAILVSKTLCACMRVALVPTKVLCVKSQDTYGIVSTSGRPTRNMKPIFNQALLPETYLALSRLKFSSKHYRPCTDD